MTNLPDDWGMYYGTCGECDERYHASGAETCRCHGQARCDECAVWHDHDDLTGGVCPGCREDVAEVCGVPRCARDATALDPEGALHLCAEHETWAAGLPADPRMDRVTAVRKRIADEGVAGYVALRSEYLEAVIDDLIKGDE